MLRNYWMLITNPENFEVTRKLGFTLQGLRPQHQRKVQRIEPGDRILFYIGGQRYFAATATATSRYFKDDSPVWKREGTAELTFRVRIRPEIVLADEEFMDARQLAPRLDYVRKWPPEDWYLAFAQTNLHLLPKKDFMLIEEEMRKIRAKSPRRHPRARTRTPKQPEAAPRNDDSSDLVPSQTNENVQQMPGPASPA